MSKRLWAVYFLGVVNNLAWINDTALAHLQTTTKIVVALLWPLLTLAVIGHLFAVIFFWASP